MKKLILCLLLTLSLALSACGQTTPAQGESQTPEPGGQTQPADPADADSVETETTQDADRNLTPEELARPASTELTFLLEGQEETVPAALYLGQGYSLYIFTEDWMLKQSTEDGVPVEAWVNLYNDDVKLWVLHLGDRSLEDCYAWVLQEEGDDYVLSEDKQGGLYGESQEDRMVLEGRFYGDDGQRYGLLWEYPMEAAEGFGVRLSVMADTFEAMA